MIPSFPKFKCLEWADRAEVDQYTADLPPYSDFNFVSMWSWNTRDKMMLTLLNGNLVLLFYDYLTMQPFLSFIGSNAIPSTAGTLLDYSECHLYQPALKLIPEQVASQLCHTEFKVTPDAEAHDYILAVSHLSNLDKIAGSKSLAAYQCRKFLQLYPNHSVKCCLAQDANKAEYMELFKQWAKRRNLNHRELNEYCAFEKFIGNKETGNCLVSIHESDKMIGFATYEILPNQYAVCHFAKADQKYKGIYDVLYFMVGTILQRAGVQYWNFEQDLGIPGLRQSKRKYNPEFYLKKFIVTR